MNYTKLKKNNMKWFNDKIETIKWGIKELVKTLSSQPSFFSSKRIERAIAFISGEVTLLSFFFYNLKTLPTLEAIMIATVFFAVAGYVLTKTEKAKDKQLPDDGKES